MIPRRLVMGWFFGSFLLPGLLSADCSFRPIYSQPFRTTALDVAIEGDDLWLATSYGVELYNRRAGPPALIARLGLPGTTIRVEPAGRLTYVASGSSIFVLTRDVGLKSVGSLDLGGAVNDLLLSGQHLYAATATGVVQVDLLLPDRPVVGARLATTTGTAFSLARLGTTLYAADGDGTVEAYTIQIPQLPQKVGTFATTLRASAVHAGGTSLFVSDGQQTEIFGGTGAQMTRFGTIPFAGSIAFHPLSAEVVFMAGLDRRLRAIEISSSTVLFDTALPVTGGNVNRVLAMAGTPGQLYVAGGDLGLFTYDIELFRSPFAIHGYSLAAARSVVESGPNVFASFEGDVIRAFTRSPGGTLVPRSQVSGSMVLDAGGNSALIAAGSGVTLWDSSAGTSRTVALPAITRSGVLLNSSAYLVLSDRSVWRVDFSQSTLAATAVTIAGARPSFIARDGPAIATADLEESGTTTIRYFAAGDLAASPQIVSIEGAATSGISISAGGVGAAATFRGVILLDFNAGSSVVLPQTNITPTRDLQVYQDDLYVLTPNKLQIWSISGRSVRREIALASEGVALHRSEDEITIATTEGLVTVAPDAQTGQPELISEFTDSAYFKKVVVGGSFLYLFDGRSIDAFFAPAAGYPSFQRRFSSLANPIDLAASADRLFVLSGSGRVTSLRPDGAIEAEYQISEGENAQPLSIHVVAGAVYVAISKGCLSGTCEKKTLVLDPRNGSLVQTSSMTGGMMDAAVAHPAAYAIFDLPREIRVLNVSDPFRPVITVNTASEGEPVSVAYSAAQQLVYTLGEKLYGYTAGSLSKIGEQLSSYATDPSARLSYFDQSLRVLNDCAVIAGRAYNPELRQITGTGAWQPASTPRVPSPVRSLSVRDGQIFLLSDHSLEIWSSLPPPPRVRGVRR